MKKIKEWNFRKLKYGAGSLILIILFIVIVLALNIILSLLSDRLNLRVDLTANKTFTLSEEGEEYIKNVQTDINVYVLGTEENFAQGNYFEKEDAVIYLGENYVMYYESINETLKNLEKMNGRIKVQYIDIVRTPSFYNKFPNESLKEGQIIVESEKRNAILDSRDYLTVISDSSNEYYMDYVSQGVDLQKVSSSNFESVFCSALLKVSVDETQIVTFLRGCGETELTGLENLLSKNSYDVQSCNVLSEDIDVNSQFLVIAAPTMDYSQEILAKIENYLDNCSSGGNILVILSNAQPELRNLYDFLAEWGISVEAGVVADENRNNYYTSPYEIFGIYGDTEYDGSLRGIPLVPNSRGLTVNNVDGIETAGILKSGQTGVLVPADATELPDDSTLRDSYNLITVSEKSKGEAGMQRLFVSGSVEFFRDDILASPSLDNANLSANIFNKSSGITVSLADKVIAPDTFVISGQQVDIIGTWLFMVIVPGAALIAGFIVWVRRKNR